MSLKINEARIIGFKLLSYELKFFKVLAKYMKVSDAFWFCQRIPEPTNLNGSRRMNLELGQFSVTGNQRIFASPSPLDVNY